MKKLFFLIPTLDGGGAEKVLSDLVNNLDKDKYEITVKTLLSGGVNEKRLKADVNYSSFINCKSWILRKIIFYLFSFVLPAKLTYRMIVKGKYDIEVSYLEGVTTKIIAASNSNTSEKIAFVHTDLSRNYLLTKVYKTYDDCFKSYQSYNKIVFVSNKARIGFEEAIGHLTSSIVLHNVLDEKAIIELSKEELGEGRNENFLFVSVGRLCYQKGYDRLIEATTKLNAEHFNFEIWIIGEGPDRQNLENLLRSYKIHNIKLLGYNENPYKYIRKSDMFICSSRAEGYSTVVSEAIILKNPILTTDCAGMDEILESGKYGLIVENSADGIYYGMKKILENPDEYKKYLLLAQERSNFFSMEQNILGYEKLFKNGSI